MKKFFRIMLCMILVLTMVMALVACGEKEDGDGSGDKEDVFGSEYDAITIAEAIEIAMEAGQSATSQKYTIVGVVKEVSNATYGEMIVKDDTGELYIYGSMAEDGTYYDSMTDRPNNGDNIVLEGVLMTYNGTPQMATKNNKAIILDFEHVKEEIDINDYKECSISSARSSADGTKVRVGGIVSKITYANGKKPNGFILIDESASIYVFDATLAQQVNEGNKIEIGASKTRWILETEQNNAALHGYNGAYQLVNATLISNDNGDNVFDKSWIEQKSIKQIMNSDISGSTTSLVYKTVALVEKREGTGFTNYYFFDLDGNTGSYAYTQCNGADFAWLDGYDKKICTVYLTALNAKSTPAECFFRLLPIEVEEIENFSFAPKDIPAFAIEYGVNDLISSKAYGSNPAIELPLSYSNEIIGADKVIFEYSSLDENVATIDDMNGAKVLNLIGEGSADIKITATYKTFSATMVRSVTYSKVADYQTPTVAQIIAKEDGSAVRIRGVVMSSLVNRDGFYICDNTGMIAVLTTGDVLASTKPGDEVVVEGYKVHYKKADSNNISGQCAIVGTVTANGGTSDTKLLANYYGDHDYTTGYFIDGMTIDDLYNLDASIDYTTNVYKVSAKVVVNNTQYYSNILLQDEGGNNQLRLYSKSVAQYSWLEEYEGEVIEIHLAVCNWNDKNYYTGCVIAIVINGERIINTLNFNQLEY